jgi:hypothetical protein
VPKLSDLTNSLAVAHRLRAQGYDNLLESQPELRDAFIVLWQQGNSLHECHRQLTARYIEAHVPSVKALSSYVKNHLKHSTIASRSPEYVQLAAKFDSVKEMYRIAIETEKRYKYAVEYNASWRTQSMWLNNLMRITEKVLDMELKLGLRQSASASQEPVTDARTTADPYYDDNPEQTLQRGVDVIKSFDEFRSKVESLQTNPINALAE